MEKIAVLGAGTMGSKIAKVYALSGYSVSLFSRTEKTLASARKIIGDLKIECTTDIQQAVKNAFYVVETVAEKKEAKEEIYKLLDSVLPFDVYISSNTSYMNIFEFMPEKRLPFTTVVHWFAPADILPLVEIVKGEKTLQKTVDMMKTLHEKCGKTPVILEKFVPGFIINRLQSAMTREIVFLLENGFCTPSSLDTAVKSSLMPRGLLLGVVQRMDFGGIDVVSNGIENKNYTPAPPPSEDNIISKLAKSGSLGIKTGKGFYDYSGKNYQELTFQRDEMLKESVKLAQKFISNPIGKKIEK